MAKSKKTPENVRWTERRNGLDVVRAGRLVEVDDESFIVEYDEKQWDPASCECNCDTTTSTWWFFCATKKPYTRTFRETIRRAAVKVIKPAALVG
jgi:hypothetical protein